MSAQQIRSCVDLAMDAQALNRQQAAALFNPTPQVDSLAERIIRLEQHGVPAHTIRLLIENVRDVLDLNAAEGGQVHALTGTLDELARVYREREKTPNLVEDLTIRGLARSLRPDLATIAAGASAKNFTAAGLRVGDIVRRTPAERLLGKSLRHDLGERPHALLVEFVRQGATK